MKAVLISIRPKWCEKIISGEKTIEVRKTRPKMYRPFKCYIYCTKDKHLAFMQNASGTNLIACMNAETAIPVGGFLGNGKVIGEFLCDEIINMPRACGAAPVSRSCHRLRLAHIQPQDLRHPARIGRLQTGMQK